MGSAARRIRRQQARDRGPAARKNGPQFYNLVTREQVAAGFGWYAACDAGHVSPVRRGQYTCPADRGDGLRCANSVTRMDRPLTLADAIAQANPSAAVERRDAVDEDRSGIAQFVRARRSGIALP